MADYDIGALDWDMDPVEVNDDELIPMEDLGQKDIVIDSLLEKFGGNLDDMERDLMRLQLRRDDDTWFFHTELDGKPVEVKLTGRSGRVLAHSSIVKAKGGAEFFRALGPDRPARTQRVPLEPTIVDRLSVDDEMTLQQEIEDIVNDETSPLRSEDRRELRGVATTLASTASKVKSAAVNVEWAERELAKARKERGRATEEDDIRYWDEHEEVARFETQEVIYKRTYEALKQGETSQVERLKSMLRNLGDDERALGEKLRELFRQEGVTLISIVTALVMTITSIGLAITNAVKSTVAPAPPSPPGDPGKSPVREAIRKFAEFLKNLVRRVRLPYQG